MLELYPSNKFLLRGEDYTVCSRWGVCVVKLQPSFGGEFWILGDVFIEVGGGVIHGDKKGAAREDNRLQNWKPFVF